MAIARRDVVAQIVTFNAGREPERLALKYRAMRRSAFAFLRGTAHVHWHDAARVTVAPAPPVWCCGDLHLENFGAYRGDSGLAYFDLTDFDEAALAPATWEIARLVTSLMVAAHAGLLGTAPATGLASAFLDAYRRALGDGTARWIERATAQGVVRDLLRQVKRRTPASLLDARTVGRGARRRLRIDGARMLTVDDADRARVERAIAAFAATRSNPAAFAVLDVARRVAGTASLGIGRYVVLLRGTAARGGNFLVDLKEAQRSTLAAASPVPQPAWPDDAARIVGAGRRMQVVTPAFLHAVHVGPTAYVLRELQPSEDRVKIDTTSDVTSDRTRDATIPPAALPPLLRAMGALTAWAQLRSSGRDGSASADELMAFAARSGWKRDTMRAARTHARQAIADWHRFAAAYDAGALGARDARLVIQRESR